MKKPHQMYVEREKDGRWAVRRKDSKHASHVLPTQAAAIKKAKQMEPGSHPLVERARNTKSGSKGKWRSTRSSKAK